MLNQLLKYLRSDRGLYQPLEDDHRLPENGAAPPVPVTKIYLQTFWRQAALASRPRRLGASTVPPGRKNAAEEDVLRFLNSTFFYTYVEFDGTIHFYQKVVVTLKNGVIYTVLHAAGVNILAGFAPPPPGVGKKFRFLKIGKKFPQVPPKKNTFL